MRRNASLFDIFLAKKHQGHVFKPSTEPNEEHKTGIGLFGNHWNG